jgi:hypothetical protein
MCPEGKIHTVVLTPSAAKASRVSAIMVGKKPYESLDEFVARTDIYMLSWYANNVAILIRDVGERVRNGENLPVEYILSRMPVVRIIPAHAAAPVPNRVGLSSASCRKCGKNLDFDKSRTANEPQAGSNM